MAEERSFWQERRQKVLAKSGGVCFYCKQPLEKMHMDHVVPRARGGSDDIDNLVASCVQCNLKKGTSTPLGWSIRETIYSFVRKSVVEEFGPDVAEVVTVSVPREFCELMAEQLLGENKAGNSKSI